MLFLEYDSGLIYTKRCSATNCLISVNGTDFRIREPTVFSPKWFSYKFKGGGLCYEVGLLLETGDIMWVNGPFACRKWIDLEICRVGLKRALLPH